MALQAKVQYVTYPVDGTAARKAERITQRTDPAPVYSHRRAERKVIAVDLYAVCGIVLSAVMLMAMVFGLVEYRSSLQKAQQMNAHVQQLQTENLQLQQEYQAGYDLEEIRDIALEAGMVPAESLSRVRVELHAPQQEDARMSLWDTVTTFLTGIFA